MVLRDTYDETLMLHLVSDLEISEIKKTNLKSLIATHISLEPASKEDLDRG